MTAYKTNQKSKKSTRKPQPAMTAAELKRLRLEMGFDKASLALTLELPYRTLQDYEAGRRSIPAKFSSKMRAAHRADRRFMAGVARRTDRELRATYPRGIPSETINNDDEDFY